MPAAFKVGARERNPRTNEEAAEYWADGILQREPMTGAMDVNSVQLRGDTIYSFGRHFPMAKIIRDSRGRAVRVVTNSDYYPSRGWANTGGDQWNVRHAVEDRIARAGRTIRHDHLPMSDYGHRAALRLRPELNDLEPEPYPQTEVPPYFTAQNPGPEPVDDGVGCIAGTRESHVWSDKKYAPLSELRADDVKLKPGTNILGETYWWVWRTTEGFIAYQREAPTHWDRQRAADERYTTEVKQCPHCEAFAQRHRRWSIYMNGGWDWSHGRQRVKGYAEYLDRLELYGGADGWRQARRDDLRRVRRLKALRAAWEARNYCTLSEAPKDRHGIVKLDADGYVPRRPVERYRERLAIEARKAERRRKRDQREMYEHMRRQARARKAALKQWVETGVTDVDDAVIDWCVTNGITPNPDGTVTLVKAVKPDFFSGYNGGIKYEPGTTVKAPDYTPTPHCGHGLHFGPNKAVAATYLSYYTDRGQGPVFLRCRVPLATLIPVRDKAKAESCYVEGVLS